MIVIRGLEPRLRKNNLNREYIKTDYHCTIKETLFIQELKPAFNVNVSSEKLS